MQLIPSCFVPPEYHTDPAQVRLYPLRRVLGNGFCLYLRVLKCMLVGQYYARRNALDRQVWIHLSMMNVQALERCGALFHVTGLDHLYNTAGPVVVVGNHMSTLETFALPSIIARGKPLGFVVKKSLTTHPIFGPIMRSQAHIALERKNPREDLKAVMERGVEMLKNGYSLCIFPQSTRHFNFVEAEFNTLGEKLAKRAGVPVIPLALRTDFWGNGKLVKDLGHIGGNTAVNFAFGPPVPTGSSPQETHAYVVNYVKKHLQEWGVPCIAPSAAAATSAGAESASA